MSVSTPGVYDFVVIGSGFGGSVSAMRLAEKGYSVLVLERGKRFQDQDFPENQLESSQVLLDARLALFRHPADEPFSGCVRAARQRCGRRQPGLRQCADGALRQAVRQPVLETPGGLEAGLAAALPDRPAYAGRCPQPALVARRPGPERDRHRVGQPIHFPAHHGGRLFRQPGDEGQELPDPYFGGAGPARSACTHCGGCMLGCRINAKNTLEKNYLYFAEQRGVQIRPGMYGQRCPPAARRSTGRGALPGALSQLNRLALQALHARSAPAMSIFSAGSLGTLQLLFRCRDINRSLPDISPRLGSMVRTNSESLLGSTSRDRQPIIRRASPSLRSFMPTRSLRSSRCAIRPALRSCACSPLR